MQCNIDGSPVPFFGCHPPFGRWVTGTLSGVPRRGFADEPPDNQAAAGRLRVAAAAAGRLAMAPITRRVASLVEKCFAGIA